MIHPTLRPFTPQELKAREIPKPFPSQSPPTPFPLYSPPPINVPTQAELRHPRRFDQETYNQITGLDARLMEQIDYDTRQQAKHSKTGARYSIKSEAWYAKVLGVRRETISDHVQKLARLGILEITRRRKVRGTWQTNMYKIKSWVWWKLGKLMRGLKKSPHRVTQTAHKAIREGEYDPEERTKGGAGSAFTQEILARWQSRGYPLIQTST